MQNILDKSGGNFIFLSKGFLISFVVTYFNNSETIFESDILVLRIK